MKSSSMIINLNVLGAFIESRIVGKKDGSLVIIIHGHDILYRKTKLLKK